MLYPTGIKADYSYAAGHFTVDKRPVMPLDDNSKEYFLNMQTLPHQTFVDVTDEKYGVAFINNCLTEYELKNDGKGTLALTLLKSVKNTICTAKRLNNSYPEQKGGQCFGHHSYEYAIYPHSGNWEDANVYGEAQRFNIIPAAMQTAPHTHGSIKPNSSMYSIENEKIIMSAFKKAEDRDALVMRLYNPTDDAITTNIRFGKMPKDAYIINLNEERENKIDIAKPITIGKQKIVTIEIEV